MPTLLSSPISPTVDRAVGLDLESRILGDCGDPAAGPTLVAIGGLHGNEPAGVLALRRIFARLADEGCAPAGRLLGLAGNREALRQGRRFLDEDLNRIWSDERLESVRSSREGRGSEDRELMELDEHLERALEEASGPAFVLDLHTTSGPGPAFSVLHDTLMNRRFARALRIPIALGLEEELNGTLTDHLTSEGFVALTVETGQHQEPESVDRAEAALWVVMDVAGCLPAGYEREAREAARRLAEEGRGLPRVVEVRYREAIGSSADYSTRPGLRSFQGVSAGQLLADRNGSPVAAPLSGLLLMPLYQKLGDDGFFIARPVHRAWMALSTALRRLRLERWLGRLPGIRAVDAESVSFLVDRRVARWLALELFHLLGFRRREHSSTHLLMERRIEPAFRSGRGS